MNVSHLQRSSGFNQLIKIYIDKDREALGERDDEHQYHQYHIGTQRLLQWIFNISQVRFGMLCNSSIYMFEEAINELVYHSHIAISI